MRLQLPSFLGGLTFRQKVAVVFGVALLIVSVAAVIWTFMVKTPASLPGYSLDSPVVFRFERALALSVAFAVLGAISARLIAGDLPSGITTSGVQWQGEEAIPAALEKTAALLESTVADLSETQALVDGLKESSAAHAEAITLLVEGLGSLQPVLKQVASLGEAFAVLSARIDQLEGDVAGFTDPSAKVDQLEEGVAAFADLSAKIDQLEEDLARLKS